MAGSKLFRSIIDKSNLTDCFRYLYPNKKSATWVGTASNYGLVGTRIDIFYISSSNNDSIIGFETLPCSCSDHNYILLRLKSFTSNAATFGKSYWKFNNDLLRDDEFLKSFRFFWDLISRSSDTTLDWWDNMKKRIRIFALIFLKLEINRFIVI